MEFACLYEKLKEGNVVSIVHLKQVFEDPRIQQHSHMQGQMQCPWRLFPTLQLAQYLDA
jgi:hypothetical protein